MLPRSYCLYSYFSCSVEGQYCALSCSQWTLSHQKEANYWNQQKLCGRMTLLTKPVFFFPGLITTSRIFRLLHFLSFTSFLAMNVTEQVITRMLHSCPCHSCSFTKFSHLQSEERKKLKSELCKNFTKENNLITQCGFSGGCLCPLIGET